MKIHAIQHASRVNGPGIRSVVWVQGCQNMGPNGHCAGCWNPNLWDANGGTEYDPKYLADQIFAHCAPGTEGLTISGGEPLQQAVRLPFLLREVKARRPDWSIGLFSGYAVRELAGGRYRPDSKVTGYPKVNKEIWQQIKSDLDFGIFGRFDRTKPTGPGALVSSANQRIELFSMRYTLADFGPLQVEFSIDDTGMTKITGFPIRRSE